VELVRSLGADHVVDDTREDFTRNGRRYGVVFDLVGNRSLTELRRTLTPTGTLLLSGGGVSTGGRLVGPFTLALKAQVLARFVPHPARHDDRGAAYQGAPGGPEGAHRVRQGHPDH
jgi:NADPH:quinone reductase-like Zn-dependent oxidoreductase